MALPTMAWEGYPPTPISDKYDSSYIYQAIVTSYHVQEGEKIRMVLSQTPFYYYYKNGTRIRSSSTIYYIEYENGNWGHVGNVGSTQGFGFIDILQSTHDIYTDSSLTDVFFSATRKTPMQETLTQYPPLSLMKPLISGISPFLIGMIIFGITIWKALSFIIKTLRGA